MKLGAVAAAVLFFAPLAARAALITGTVIGDGSRPIESAVVEVVGAPDCRTTTAADGTFSLACAATGRYVVRAFSGDLVPWEVSDIELDAGYEIHLNFMLLPATHKPAIAGSGDAASFWERRVPNPVLGSWGATAITLRLLAIAVAAMSFVLGALTMLGFGRRFGIEARSLSADAVGDMLLNPNMPQAGQRVTPVAVVGARGAEAQVRYGADEITAAISAGRYGLVFVALVVAPGLFALSTLAFLTAMLVDQEWYLLCAALLVPAGFVLTPIVIGVQALARSRSALCL